MKKIIGILVLFLALFISSCTNYHYEYQIKVVYQNGDSEMINPSRDSFNGNDVRIYHSNYKGSSTLKMICGGETKILATGVRRYEILEEKKTELKK